MKTEKYDFTTQHGVDLSAEERLERCPLYQAIRWVAFNEKPINPALASILLPYYDEPNEWADFSEQDNFLLDKACKDLQLKLFKGELGAKGIICEKNSPASGKTINIPPSLWAANSKYMDLKELFTNHTNLDVLFNEINWPFNDMSLEIQNWLQAEHREMSIVEINLDTEQLLNVFSPRKVKSKGIIVYEEASAENNNRSAHMSGADSNNSKIQELLYEEANFKFCGPSDDPDEITGVTLGYRHLMCQLRYLLMPVLPKRAVEVLERIAVEPNNIYSAYEAQTQFATIAGDIKEALESDTKPKRSGRKPKYDWQGRIYPEIIIYIHENGHSDNASKMAEDIYEICSQKFGESNTPDIETLRKVAIRPIIQRFNAGNN